LPTLFWDASGLVKRYTAEQGSDVADALFAAVPASAMITTVWGYAETFSILLRKRNDGRLNTPAFNTAAIALRREVIDSRDMGFLVIDESAVLAGLSLMEQHNVNTTDASLLAAFLRCARSQHPAASSCILAAADKRLLRAAEAEGLQVLDLQALSAADVPTFLAG